MNERLRMEYLDAMGITMFVPRRVLPCARASVAAMVPLAVPQVADAEEPRIPESLHPTAEIELKQEIPDNPRPIQTSVNDIMETFTRPARPAEVMPPPAVVAPTGAAEPPVQFALSIWRPSPALMILDSRHAGGALPTHALLDNILRAKGLASRLSKPDVLIWPPAGMAPMPGWDAAREMLQAFLQARLERQPAQYLWLMGESACSAVLAGRSFADSLGLAINLDNLASLAVILPSLAEMLQQPSLKARTWAAIRTHHVS